MRFRQLGQNGPTISALGYGTWQAGGTDWRELPRETVINAIRSALDAGANWLDTAELYGHGRAEELVAEAVSDRTGADKPLIFTKVAPSGYGSGLDRDGIRRAAEASLSRLGVERIDLYQVHWFEESGAVDTGPSPISVETSWSAMAELVQDGLVSHIGVSNVDRATVERCGALHEVTSVQNEFSMLCRGDVDDLLPWLAEQGIGYLCYSPLASGLLTGAIDEATTFDRRDWRSGQLGWTDFSPLFAPEYVAANLETVARLRVIGENLGRGIAELALKWVLAQGGVSGAIIGSCNPEHVRQSLGCADGGLSSGVMQELAELLR